MKEREESTFICRRKQILVKPDQQIPQPLDIIHTYSLVEWWDISQTQFEVLRLMGNFRWNVRARISNVLTNG